MRIYKELKFVGDKSSLDILFSEIYNYFPTDWSKPKSDCLLKDYIVADYIGNLAPHAEVSIYYGPEIWYNGYLQVGNIVPLDKAQLTIDEYNHILELFYTDIVVAYCRNHTDIQIVGPTSDIFDPLNYITAEALKKLTLFCNTANKSTGSSHLSDEKRWFDFVCQTVDDNKVFDYDTLCKFLMDEDYWGRKENESLEVIGRFVWSEEKAGELAAEYESYVRLLQYYKNREG